LFHAVVVGNGISVFGNKIDQFVLVVKKWSGKTNISLTSELLGFQAKT